MYTGHRADLMYEFHQNQLVGDSAALGNCAFNLNHQTSVYNNLKALLTEKYGPPAKTESIEYPLGGEGIITLLAFNGRKIRP